MAEKKKKAANPAITAKAAKPAKAVSLPGQENAAGTDAKPAVDFSDPKYYVCRELSWIAFDERVLAEARDKNTS